VVAQDVLRSAHAAAQKPSSPAMTSVHPSEGNFEAVFDSELSPVGIGCEAKMKWLSSIKDLIRQYDVAC
jgi:hypothetical protein